MTDLTSISLRHALHLERLKAGEVKKYNAFLKDMAKQIKVRLSGDELTDFTRFRLEKLIKLIVLDIKVIQSDFEREFIEMGLDLAKYEAEFEIKSLETVLAQVNHTFTLPSEKQLATAILSTPMTVQGFEGALLESFTKDMTASAITKVSNNIRYGVVNGLTNQEIIKNIIGKRSKKYSDGEFLKLKRDTEAMVRTGIANISSNARRATWEKNMDVIAGFKISVTFDGRTSKECQYRGTTPDKIYKIDVDPMPPFHVRCRSTAKAALKKEFEFLDKGATRSARDDDGKVYSVDSKKTYYSFLRDQSAGFQDSVIGKKRGKLLRNGGLSIERFSELQMNNKFQPTTLARMRELEPLAFERAGI